VLSSATKHLQESLSQILKQGTNSQTSNTTAFNLAARCSTDAAAIQNVYCILQAALKSNEIPNLVKATILPTEHLAGMQGGLKGNSHSKQVLTSAAAHNIYIERKYIPSPMHLYAKLHYLA